MRRKAIISLSLAVFVGALAALPASASASSMSLTCAVSGTGTFAATYDLQTTLVCEGTINGVTDAPAIDWHSTGSWTGDCLGDGTMDSTSDAGTVTQSFAGNTGTTFGSLPYRIDFQHGVGILTFKAPASGSGVIYLSGGPPLPPCAGSYGVSGLVSFVV